jgi:hypothetical protein
MYIFLSRNARTQVAQVELFKNPVIPESSCPTTTFSLLCSGP